ncbi:hypothetical protein PoB_001388700 [Plakobranchus ocellatus]|uniref:Transmembrane protein n=1 Tax=Plakobranchus ocellatus TaxID=259542 RepID=A0AAV3YYU6_9GAST|nr:hypothetical protein PoB_001388700 [Plakobranchus ocellatus]
MKPSSPSPNPPSNQNAALKPQEMDAGKAEMTYEAEEAEVAEATEDGEADVTQDLDRDNRRGSISKSEGRGGDVAHVGVARCSPGTYEGRVSSGENVCCGEGRVWIFLVLGLMMLVFCGAVMGVFMTARTLTTSVDKLEVMPTYVPVSAVSAEAYAVCYVCCMSSAASVVRHSSCFNVASDLMWLMIPL